MGGGCLEKACVGLGLLHGWGKVGLVGHRLWRDMMPVTPEAMTYVMWPLRHVAATSLIA